MRVLLSVAGVLVFLAGVQLFVFPERTDRYFAWTIDPPLTAAFLGAGYWSSVALEWTAARERVWARARVAAPTVFVFATLTLVVTLVHLDRFHLETSVELGTRAVTWAWMAIYVTVPVLMVVLFVLQRREGGVDPPKSSPLPPWVMAILVVEAGAFLVFGALLLIAPGDAGAYWPWSLTPLTARAIGAWLFSLGFAAAHAVWEGDASRLTPVAVGSVGFGILQTVALLRYGGTVRWDDPAALVYVVFLAATVLVGAGILRHQHEPRPPVRDNEARPRET